MVFVSSDWSVLGVALVKYGLVVSPWLWSGVGFILGLRLSLIFVFYFFLIFGLVLVWVFMLVLVFERSITLETMIKKIFHLIFRSSKNWVGWTGGILIEMSTQA